MKLKYYLRGLGIGIAVTALVLTLAGGGKTSLTDEEIIARAKELGMVESVTLSQLSSEKVSETVSEEVLEDVSEELSEESNANTSQEGETSESVSGVAGEDSAESDSEAVSEENNSEEDSSEVVSETISEETSQTASNEVIDEYVIIEVGGGDGSDTVSVKLEAAGLVEDAGMYDDFLCANGYDKILQTGVHEIPRTADWDTIAEILAGRM